MQTRLHLRPLLRTACQLFLGICKGQRSLCISINPITMFLLILILIPIFIENVVSYGNTTTSISSFNNNNGISKVLSRRKRFLIFPDGSSVQLVICTQNHGYIQIGNIVWFGTTAALAWQLPNDPEVYEMFRDRPKIYEGTRRSDVIYYLDEEGRVIDRAEYKRKVIVNPAFAKRSINTSKGKNTLITRTYIKEMHNIQKNKSPLEELDATRIEFNRKERQKLYVKLGNFLQALGWNGEDCVLKMLCQTGKTTRVQGTFLEEILRAVFTLPKVHVLPEVHNQYDDAHGANGECAHLYPKCGPSTI